MTTMLTILDIDIGNDYGGDDVDESEVDDGHCMIRDLRTVLWY